MVFYDHAQSPRLGQPVTPDTTTVQMFSAADIPEANWLGRLIYRTDTQELQVWNGTAFEDVVSGSVGLLTFVGDTIPTSQNAGDLWFDTSDPAVSGRPGNRALYRAEVVGATQITNTSAIPPVTGWTLMSDANTTSAEAASIANGAQQFLDQLLNTDPTTEEGIGLIGQLSITAEATTAQLEAIDGRVSMSDYYPSVADADGKNEGSIWFTRTRTRRNHCKNPSFEVNLTGWFTTQTTSAVMDPSVPSDLVGGNYVLKVTNNATAASHQLVYDDGGARVPCEADQTWTVSGYAAKVSGLGTGYYMRTTFYDSTGTAVGGGSDGPTANLSVLSATEGEDWTRLTVTFTVPATAVTFRSGPVAPVGTEGDVWLFDGMLIEQTEELGRYFDGTSYDGFWEDPVAPHNSISALNGGLVEALFELDGGSWAEKKFGYSTVAEIDLDTVVLGELSGSRLSDITVTPDKFATRPASTNGPLAAENLEPGDLVNVFEDGGGFMVRKADAFTNREAHGFVLAAYSQPDEVEVFFMGYNAFQAGLLPGRCYLSTTPGKASATPPKMVGQTVQKVGFAVNTTTLSFQCGRGLRIT